MKRWCAALAAVMLLTLPAGAAESTPAVEAGAHIVDLIHLMLEKKCSGIDLPV